MKCVMLRMRDGQPGVWDQREAVEVPDLLDDDEPGRVPEIEAVAELKEAGVFIAVPWEVWNMLEAQAQVTVTPLQRGAVGHAPPAAAPVHTGAPIMGMTAVLDDDDGVDGLVQGPKR